MSHHRSNYSLAAMPANMFLLAGIMMLVVGVMTENGVGTSSSSSCSECKDTHPDLLQFDVVCETEEYEVRHYALSRWVSTDAEAYFMGVGAAMAFRRLYQYIIGANEEGVQIDMATPVLVRVPEETKMWEPAIYTLNFLLPSAYQHNPPNPTNDKLYFTELPEMDVYVTSYGGWMLSVNSRLQAHLLTKALERVNAHYNHTHHYAVGYDSPLKLLNRHNEVWYVVVDEPVCDGVNNNPSHNLTTTNTTAPTTTTTNTTAPTTTTNTTAPTTTTTNTTAPTTTINTTAPTTTTTNTTAPTTTINTTAPTTTTTNTTAPTTTINTTAPTTTTTNTTALTTTTTNTTASSTTTSTTATTTTTNTTAPTTTTTNTTAPTTTTTNTTAPSTTTNTTAPTTNTTAPSTTTNTTAPTTNTIATTTTTTTDTSGNLTTTTTGINSTTDNTGTTGPPAPSV